MRARWFEVAASCLVLCLPSGLLLSQQPDDFESLVGSAQQAQVRSDFQAAADFYRRAVALHPEIPELRTNLGLMYYQIGKDEQAAAAFREAIRLKPSLFVPTLFLGLDYVRSKRFNDAIPLLKKAALAKPGDVQVQLGLGQAYAGNKDTRSAIRAYDRAAELDSANPDTWYRLGVSYLQQVESDARVLLTRYKDSGYLQALLADNFSEQRAFIQATESYKKALASSAVPPDTHANYAFVLLNQHDLPGAEHELNAEVHSNPGSLLARLGFARLHAEQGATEQVANELQQIWSTDPGFFRANSSRLMTGLAQAKRSELQNALQAKQAAGQLPDEVVSIVRGDQPGSSGAPATGARLVAPANKPGGGTADQLYANGEYRRCTDLLATRVSVLQPKSLQLLVRCSYSTGDYQRAFDAAAKLAGTAADEPEALYWEVKSAQKLATNALEQASAIDTGSPKLHVLLGDLYRQRNFFPDAEQEYRKALALAPDDTGALFGLSLALLGDNQLDQAFEVAQAALKRNPDDPELNAVMGEILCGRDESEAAEPYLKKGLNTKPEYVSHVHALLGKVYTRANRIPEAIAELKLALPGDKDGTIHYQIARLYLKTGDRDAAQQAFKISEQLRSEGLNRAAVALDQGKNDAESQ